MRLVVGLRNPGSRYEGTRHNVGATAVMEFGAVAGSSFRRAPQGARADIATVHAGGTPVVLAIPRTFMNESGDGVSPLLRYYSVAPDDLLVAHDDIDLEFGDVRVQIDRGAGGHNGVRSIIKSLGTQEFWRLRMGVGRPPGRVDPADYVLDRFSKSERAALGDFSATAAALIETFAASGGETARQRAGEMS